VYRRGGGEQDKQTIIDALQHVPALIALGVPILCQITHLHPVAFLVL